MAGPGYSTFSAGEAVAGANDGSTSGHGGGRALDQMMSDLDHILHEALVGGAAGQPSGRSDGSGDAAAAAALLRGSPLRTHPAALELLQVCKTFTAQAGRSATQTKTPDPEDAWDQVWVSGMRRMVRECLGVSDAGTRQQQLLKVHRWVVNQNGRRPAGPVDLQPPRPEKPVLYSHLDSRNREQV